MGQLEDVLESQGLILTSYILHVVANASLMSSSSFLNTSSSQRRFRGRYGFHQIYQTRPHYQQFRRVRRARLNQLIANLLAIWSWLNSLIKTSDKHVGRSRICVVMISSFALCHAMAVVPSRIPIAPCSTQTCSLQFLAFVHN